MVFRCHSYYCVAIHNSYKGYLLKSESSVSVQIKETDTSSLHFSDVIVVL